LLALVAIVCWQAWTRGLAERLELWLHGEQPLQFYLDLSSDLLDDYSQVFGVAHNSGDRVSTTRKALEHGADVIEIDVVSIESRLYAAHASPPIFIRAAIYQGPTLATAWEAASDADVIKLDLKESSPAYLDAVVEFLNARQGHEVIVSTRDRVSLTVLAAGAPQAYRFLSIGSLEHFGALQRDPLLAQLIDGVTIRAALLDETTAAWLHEQGLLIIAWTVDDLARVNELVALGVHGITTNNLAILELLGSQGNSETLLATARASERLAAEPDLP
jgi:hypothetical protein